MNILALGNATIDLFFHLPSAHLHTVDLKAPELCLPYGDRVYVDKMDISLGGNAPNTGSGLIKMGHSVSLFAQVGQGFLGDLAWQKLKDKGFNLQFSQRGGAADISAILSYQGDRTILICHPPRNFSFEKLRTALDSSSPDWIYLGALGTGDFQDLHQNLATWLKENPTIKLVYNPGKPELQKGAAGVPVLTAVHTLVLNKQEAGQLLEQEVPVETPVELVTSLAKALHQQGPKNIIITDGEQGSYGFDGENFWQMPNIPVTIVERTGAGDAFAAGAMAALMEGQDLPVALRWGSFQAAAVVQVVGATEGFLTKAQLDEILESTPQVAQQLVINN